MRTLLDFGSGRWRYANRFEPASLKSIEYCQPPERIWPRTSAWAAATAASRNCLSPVA